MHLIMQFLFLNILWAGGKLLVYTDNVWPRGLQPTVRSGATTDGLNKLFFWGSAKIWPHKEMNLKNKEWHFFFRQYVWIYLYRAADMGGQ